MKVAITGGTGYVGATIVASLVAEDHDVRLLARDPARVPRALDQHDPELAGRVSIVPGDATAPADVEALVDGADVVVHAAAIYSLDRARAEEIARTNVRAAEVVLGAGVAAGCRRIIHVSSTVAILRRDGDTSALAVGDLRGPYTESKIGSERVARRLQDEGAPVVIVYPGPVLGPRDHYLGDQAARLRLIALGRFPFWPKGHIHFVDVREVAACVGALAARGEARPGYVVPGHSVDADLLFGAVERAIGRRRLHLVLPTTLATLSAGASRLFRGPRGWRYPVDPEGIDPVVVDNRFDDSPARQDLGVTPRPWDETVADTIDWMVSAGHLPASLVRVPRTASPNGGA